MNNKFKIGILLTICFGILLFIFVYIGGYLSIQTDKITLNNAKVLNFVEVDGIKINMRKYGNINSPKHTIVCISDYKDDDFSITSELITKNQLTDNQVVVVDRPGYGFSDDSTKEQSIDYILSIYRNALSKSDIKPPYILVGDGFGAVYATYWESTFENEIEGMILINPFIIPDTGVLVKTEDQYKVSSADLLYVLISKMGFHRLFVNLEDIVPWAGLKKEYAELSKPLSYKNHYSYAKHSENVNKYNNLVKVSKNFQTTDMPKLFINSVLNNKNDAEEYYKYMNSLYEESGSKSPYLLDEKNIAYQYARYERQNKEFKTTTIDPYLIALGNTYYEYIPGYERIYIQKPDEVQYAVDNYMKQFN